MHANAGPAASLGLASPRVTAKHAAANRAPALLAASGASAGRLTLALARELEQSGRAAVHLRAPDDKEAWAKAVALRAAAAGTIDIVHLIGPRAERASAALGAVILRVAATLEALRSNQMQARLWLVTRDGSAGDEMAAGVLAFGRVATNEYPDIDIRLVDLSSDLDEAGAAARLSGLLAAPGVETEMLLDRAGVSVIRAMQGLASPATPAADNNTARLHFAPPDLPSRLEWRAEPRAPLADDEVEIEVAATGLNFRDVMLATGLLPDDILADGYAGSTLGLECAGRISRVGGKVTDLKPGDPVASFARGAFANHVTVPAALVLPLPPSMPPEAAATIPVAFLTAWYGLIHLAKLKRNEWVLIHAAAGGVGLAALQIARWRGARVVATAGSNDKRALVRLLGADMVLDSRSLRFADEIRKSIGGVDVVLNSLAGEAMEASFKALKPFGRFVELGKRDYVANSRIGLRPFRQNLTYFGVDADQLLTHQRPLARKLNRELTRHFAEGAFTPLPYRVFEADEIDDALLLMQRAAHVGKIVVRPPAAMPPQRDAAGAFTARAEGCHLVIGGTSALRLRDRALAGGVRRQDHRGGVAPRRDCAGGGGDCRRAPRPRRRVDRRPCRRHPARLGGLAGALDRGPARAAGRRHPCRHGAGRRRDVRTRRGQDRRGAVAEDRRRAASRPGDAARHARLLRAVFVGDDADRQSRPGAATSPPTASSKAWRAAAAPRTCRRWRSPGDRSPTPACWRAMPRPERNLPGAPVARA